MKLRITLYLIAGLFSGLMLNGQELSETLKQRNEIYFTFQIKTTSEISELTRLISIDNVKDNQVWAYANIRQYLKFMTLGYDITLLPAPGDGPGVVMTDHVLLSPQTTWNFYPTYDAYQALMVQFQTMYPAICNLDTILTLASGRRLLVLKISDNVATDESEPEFLYTSSIHGDETTGYIMMLHLADYLLSNYGTNAEATDLVNSMEIYINPLANPDGTYYGGNSSVSGARRFNINGVDMNRNYQDPQDGLHPDGYAWQPETVGFMNFATSRHFTAACNFHGGAEVVNYPWDTWPTLHPDDTWWQYISREFADTVHLHSPSTYMDYLSNGVTNGYAWYEVNGGRQDYMNYFQHCREITIEISDVKLLAANLLETHWTYLWRSLIQLLKESRYGLYGIITDQVTGLPVAAKVFITGHDNNGSEVYSSATLGDYHRPLKAGTYTLEISAPCYQTQTITGVTVSDHATLTRNIQLVSGAGVTTTALSSISANGATSGGTVTCEGSSPVTERGVCWSTSSNPVVTGSHTSNGSGVGAYTSLITGLTGSTTYHVRAFATNANGTVYGTDIQFTTTCSGVVSTFPWYENFENAGSIPGCWTEQMVNSSGISWTFITGSGNSHPAGAHGGTYNACLKDNNSGDNKTRLISPQLNIASLPSPQVKFWHTQALWPADQDQLSVFYKTSSGGTWTLLITYTANITVWTQETLTLPAASGDYYIAFEGNAKYGYGVCVDDVEVSSSCASILPVTISIAASSSPVCAGTSVNYTASPLNGGTTPVFQWKVNGANAGSNNALFSYTPVSGDQVSCVVTSNATCVTANPATSNIIAMTVNPVLPVGVSIMASANPADAGTPVTFTATATNPGTSPVFQWKINDGNVGTNSDSYTYNPVNGDVVFCVLTSGALCTSSNPATSNSITMVVNTIPATVELQNMTVNGKTCFNATQTILVAGNETFFTIPAGDSATMIAGQNILYYPGTVVEPGGFLYGYISLEGLWCVPKPLMAVMTGIEDPSMTNGHSSFKIYPNPTNGIFSMEFTRFNQAEKTRVEIYGMTGNKVFSTEVNGALIQQFSLSGKAAGIYLLQVITGRNSETARIIKQD
ncbi:MAG: M14 family zinc carboxypeptidase [Bacteroidetes bacterium]|nr:M14 family zinc carboxypeptidase [Bacteroidota bacterium]